MRVTYENMSSGLRTIELTPQESWVVDSFLDGKLADTARSYRVNKRGLVTFKCGVGYDVIDADLLGGDGSGRTHSRFRDYASIRLDY